ncbi:hypothetical protein PL11_003910 [Lentilactobacillus curieae]|uniref:Uncharacterized protein n=1 Tax=Lentilactobacillus curieae TaxID=1138822 RepID=A0A1S6QHN7_9LACO|nr:hypothetical protein [Lentilactobacillus curieae]AQW21128.1 hypothetical protein PL11_003910 [Lentilactobacillus curieae]
MKKGIFKAIVVVIVGLVMIAFGMSLSPENAVKLRMMLDGHPVRALECIPYYDRDYSSYVNKHVYEISGDLQYTKKKNNFEVGMYKVEKHSFIYSATDITSVKSPAGVKK